VARSRNVYTSSDILTAWCHFTQGKHIYGDLMSLAIIKSYLGFRVKYLIF
jgi:hypothetical protein